MIHSSDMIYTLTIYVCSSNITTGKKQDERRCKHMSIHWQRGDYMI